MKVVLTSVVLNEEHEFAIIKKHDGGIMASYVLQGRQPPNSELRRDLHHMLKCILSAEVEIYWTPTDICSDMKANAYHLKDLLNALRGDGLLPPSMQHPELN